MSKLPWWLHLLVRILLVDVLIVILIWGWSWLNQDFSSTALSNRFFMAGTAAIVFSLAAGFGNWGNRSSWQQMLAQSAGQANLAERNQRMMADLGKVYGLALVMVPAGIIAILLAVIVGNWA
jgi:hypothetical protein